MKTYLICLAIAFFCCYNNVFPQCGMIGVIGEFNLWAEDEFMTRDLNNPDEFTLMLYLTYDDDHDGNGIIDVMFRENGDWSNIWGSSEFPNGIAVLNGPNIPVPLGSYKVTFNCNTLYYNFEPVCGMISLIGEFNGWTGDHFLERNPEDSELWSTILSLNEESSQYGDPDIVEMKFRENSNWAVNWGDDSFPSGTGTLNGMNIPVPLTSSGITTDYFITFDCSTGDYNFTETCGPISLYGEPGNGDSDFPMERDVSDHFQFSTIITLKAEDDFDGDGIINLKFRENEDTIQNWGAASFPSGSATLNGPQIPVPLDASGISTDYLVTFNYTTGVYNFEPTSGSISIIGDFNGWNGDVPMARSTSDPDIWTLTRRWIDNSAIKFRENNDWQNNWGDDSWPAGIANWNGLNIPLIEGTYNVSFNISTGAYSYANNPDACGEIGLVGDFNEWGGDDTYPYDVYLVRHPEYTSFFSLDYHFTESTTLLFRLDADPTFSYVWGGNSLCQTGIQNVSIPIQLPAGYYHITFDYNSKDYCFENLGLSFEAPEVVTMNVDGEFDEEEWELNQSAVRIIDGAPVVDLNTVTFGAVFNDMYLYVAVNIADPTLAIGEMLEFFVDGDHSGGPYDEHDVYFRYNPGSGVNVIQGPPGGITILTAATVSTEGYKVEVGIPLDALGVSPSEGEEAGFDLFAWDDDSGGYADYILSWNGDLENYAVTTGFGNLIFGNISCGCISMYNPNIGDVRLRPSTIHPEIYYATYEMFDNQSVVFRKDFSDSYFWGASAFPTGYAEPGGPGIPAEEGRYRISFNCETGAYGFSEDIPPESFANAYYLENQPVMDGQLEEYNLLYLCDNLVSGTGPVNNLVSWGTAWDEENLYIGVSVTDEALYGNGSPWENDGIEFYIDGNNDKDGQYDPEFDTQIIMDALNQSVPWFRADGVPVSNYTAMWAFTALGYNIELRLGWDNFDFDPGRGRIIGWSLGNSDNDNNAGRDYLTAWYGLEANWNNTALLGNLELYNGPYYVDIEDLPGMDPITVYPNPASGAVSVLLSSDRTGSDFMVHVYDISGKLVMDKPSAFSTGDNLLMLDLGDIRPGLYFLSIVDGIGNNYVKKLVIR